LRLAREAVHDASEQVRRTLEAFRFDPEWLDISGEEVSHVIDWYIIVLAEVLEPAPSLSHRLRVSHNVLTLVLPMVGWSAETIRELVLGHPMSTFVATSGEPVFIHDFAGVDQYGGWLPPPRIRELAERLAFCERFFVDPAPEARDEITWLAELLHEEPEGVLRKAHADAQEMLQTGIARRLPLVLVLD
jgi:hypothetical protein